MATVLVTGGTGTLGQAVVARLVSRHHAVRMLTRRATTVPSGVEVYCGDLTRNVGVCEAIAGVNTVIHCASDSTDKDFGPDLNGTRALIDAARAMTNRPHFVYPSIAGIDRSAYPYYRAKRSAEEMIEGSSLPWTIVRATQFHAFVLRLIRSLESAADATVLVPAGVSFRSVDHREVADHLVALSEQQAAGHVFDMGGPQVRSMAEMAEVYLCLCRRTAKVQPMNLSGALFETWRSGVNLVPSQTIGKVTWEAFVQQDIVNLSPRWAAQSA